MKPQDLDKLTPEQIATIICTSIQLIALAALILLAI